MGMERRPLRRGSVPLLVWPLRLQSVLPALVTLMDRRLHAISFPISLLRHVLSIKGMEQRFPLPTIADSKRLGMTGFRVKCAVRRTREAKAKNQADDSRRAAPLCLRGVALSETGGLTSPALIAMEMSFVASDCRVSCSFKG